jgi:hypothetical protein
VEKFFLFIKEGVSNSSQESSNTGFGISAVSIPMRQLVYMVPSYGKVTLFFKDVNTYDDNHLNNGESIQKTRVDILADYGKEVDLMSSITNMSVNNKESVVSIDAVKNESTVSNVRFSGPDTILIKVIKHPINRETGKVSRITDSSFTAKDTSIQGLDFGSSLNIPLADYNHAGLSSYANGATITSWANDAGATGGASYDISSLTGTPSCLIGSTTGFKEDLKACYFAANENFKGIPIDIQGDYTMYMCVGRGTTPYAHLFGDGNDETYGFAPVSRPRHTFAIRHAGAKGNPAIGSSNNTDDSTSSYEFPDGTSLEQSCYVFVVRRDIDNNIYFYNHLGELVSFIPRKDGVTNPNISTSTSGRTDGNLNVTILGASGGSTSNNSYVGTIIRFGVIERDVGHETASDIAKNIYDIYKP